MKSFSKIIISLLIVILISLISYFLIFSEIIKIDLLDFVNANLLNQFQNELNTVSIKIEDYLKEINQSEAEKIISKLDFSKFAQRKNTRTKSITNELSYLNKAILESDYQLKNIKLFDNNKNLILSTDKNEINYRNQFIRFRLTDNIVNKKDFYKFDNNELNFIFDNVNNNIILKKNIKVSEKNIGILCFYYKSNFLNDLLRDHDYINFEYPYFTNNNL